MDFQELLNIAAENNKMAQKQANKSKRYTTAIPPPKKEKRPSVDRAAIRARLEQKKHEVQQKASEEQAQKQQLLKLRAETKKKAKKGDEKPKTERNPIKQDYNNQKHEQRHQSFMKKIQKVADKTRKEETDKPVSVSKAAPARPIKPKKVASATKGPLSYDQLLALAANQQNGSSRDDSKTPTRNDCKAKINEPARQNESRNHRKDDMAAKKELAARKLGEARRQRVHEQRKNGNLKSTSGPSRKATSTTSTTSSHSHRTNGKVATTSGKFEIVSGSKKSALVTSKLSTSTAKTKHSSAGSGKTRPSVAITEERKNGALNGNRAKLAKQELERKRPPAKLHQSRVQEYFERKAVPDRPRVVPQKRSPPRHQSKMDSYYDRAHSSSSARGGRPQAGSERRMLSADGQVPRKRPAPPSSGPPTFRTKRGRLLSNEESDYEDDGFIDDTPLEEHGGEDVSHYIKEIFGYDKSKYEYVSDWQLRNMDASYREVQQEEARTARLGMQEDLEDIRREQEELKRLKLKAKAKATTTTTKKNRRR